MEARKLPSLPLDDDERLDFGYDAANQMPPDVAAHRREYQRRASADKLSRDIGDEVVTRSVAIPTRHQIQAGMSPRPISVEDDKARDIFYIQERFPVGSQIKLFKSGLRGGDEVEVFVLDVSRDADGVYLTVLSERKSKLVAQRIPARNAMDANKNIKDVEKGALTSDQVKALLERLNTGDIPKVA